MRCFTWVAIQCSIPVYAFGSVSFCLFIEVRSVHWHEFEPFSHCLVLVLFTYMPAHHVIYCIGSRIWAFHRLWFHVVAVHLLTCSIVGLGCIKLRWSSLMCSLHLHMFSFWHCCYVAPCCFCTGRALYWIVYPDFTLRHLMCLVPGFYSFILCSVAI